MSTTEAAQDAGFTATLVRGRVYFLSGKEFLVGEPKAVSAAEKAYLEENAIDFVSVEGEADYQARPKFEFAKAGDDKPAPRTRARAPAAP